jgi:hypothetical protein
MGIIDVGIRIDIEIEREREREKSHDRYYNKLNVLVTWGETRRKMNMRCRGTQYGNIKMNPIN